MGLLNKLPLFYGHWRFSTVLTPEFQWIVISWEKLIVFVFFFCNFHFNIIFISTRISWKVSPSEFRTKTFSRNSNLCHATRSVRLGFLNMILVVSHNEELYALYSSPNLVRVVKSRRMRWMGHVAFMGRRGGPENERKIDYFQNKHHKRGVLCLRIWISEYFYVYRLLQLYNTSDKSVNG
jgi:hypothetical protein